MHCRCIFALTLSNIELSLVVCKLNATNVMNLEMDGWMLNMMRSCSKANENRFDRITTENCIVLSHNTHPHTNSVQNSILLEKFDLHIQNCCHFSGNYLILHNDHKPNMYLGWNFKWQFEYVCAREFCIKYNLHTQLVNINKHYSCGMFSFEKRFAGIVKCGFKIYHFSCICILQKHIKYLSKFNPIHNTCCWKLLVIHVSLSLIVAFI